MIGSSSFPWTEPRGMIAGRPTILLVCLSIWTTTMNMPSFASARRSRSTTSPTSPTDRPSTYTYPAGTGWARAGDRRAAACGPVGEDLDRRAVLDDEHVLRQHPGLDGEPPVLDQHPELAVHRDEVLGLRHAQHQLQLFLAGVAGDVCALDRVVVDVGTGLEQVVDGPRDVFLVARDRA